MKRLSLVWSLIAVTTLIAAAALSRPAIEAAQNPAQDGMRMHERMMAEMKQGDATLTALVKDMSTAKGDAKVDAVAAVVTELVRQHKAMHERMGEIHGQMMHGRGGMMQR
jgi:hypothetical protein